MGYMFLILEILFIVLTSSVCSVEKEGVLEDNKITIRAAYGEEGHASLMQLFPDIQYGCINFGYWPEKIETPITLEQRLKSERDLYLYIFEKASL
jgi:hypothetical protein